MSTEAKPTGRRRRRGNTLERWEIAVVKAMIARGKPFTNDQDILAYFTRPTRSVNHRLIAEVRTETKHKAVKSASDADLDAFLAAWPDLDPDTGLDNRGDELLIKARESMIAAVHIFNSAGLTFRTELFIVTAMIAWTYLLHAWFKREGIEYRYEDSQTKGGADRYWDLRKCLSHEKCPAPQGTRDNVDLLIRVRDEIVHRSTGRIEDSLGAKLQACCIGFNDLLKTEFGPQHGLEKRLPLALQFVSFSTDQRTVLKKASDLPTHVATVIDGFESNLTEEQRNDPAYRSTVALVPLAKSNPNTSDKAVVVVPRGSPEAEAAESALLKEVNRPRYTRDEVLRKVHAEGFLGFGTHQHTQLWRRLDAKDPHKEYGTPGDYKNTWVWFDKWVDRVLEECRDKGEEYR